jgi:hypothetical protein
LSILRKNASKSLRASAPARSSSFFKASSRGRGRLSQAFIVRDANKQALAFVYCEDEFGRRAAANLLTRDEARRIAANIAKLPGLLRKGD